MLFITWLFVYASSVGQVAQKTEKLTDDQLLDLVQKQTLHISGILVIRQADLHVKEATNLLDMEMKQPLPVEPGLV